MQKKEGLIDIISTGEIKIGEEEKKLLDSVTESAKFSEGGPILRKFENSWARYIGTKYSLAVNSGTSALITGLLALKVKNKIPSGKKVITTPLTYAATSNAIIHAGFEPAYCDIDRERFIITPDNIEKLLEENPGDYCGIMPVHLMGYACDMDEINRIAKKHGLFVFEDAAEAHGTKYKGKVVGSLGDVSAYSFYIAHNIQAAGEMGAINSNDNDLIKLSRQIKANGRLCSCVRCTRDQGTCPYKDEDFDPRFTHVLIGYNFKTGEYPAALALAHLNKIDEIINKRKSNVKYLNEHLSKHAELQLPVYDENVSYLGYPIVSKERVKITKALEKHNPRVLTRTLFGCIPTQQPAYINLGYAEKYKGKLPNAEYVGEYGFYIGCHQFLTQKDLDNIVSAFDDTLGA